MYMYIYIICICIYIYILYVYIYIIHIYKYVLDIRTPLKPYHLGAMANRRFYGSKPKTQ